ncbi:hypothetical protein GCM10019993_06120 [Enterococcus pseudoavium]
MQREGNERAEKLFKKSKKWNMVMLVTTDISGLMGITSLFQMFTVTEEAYAVYGDGAL